MAWNWKSALGIEETTASPAAKVAERARKHSQAGNPCQANTSEVRRATGPVWSRADVRSAEWPGSLSVELLDSEEYKCAFCRGTGRLAGSGKCPVCSGTGNVQISPPAVRCAFCSGRGQVPLNSNLTCWVCKGKGLVPVSGPVQVCPDCRGRGRKPCKSLYCHRCRGVGVIASAC